MIRELNKILKQIHEPNEFRLVPHNMSNPIYWIWKVENVKLKDLNSNLRQYKNEHARFDIFINGQYILQKDYIFFQEGRDFHIAFKKINFYGAYDIETTDVIKLEGDFEQL